MFSQRGRAQIRQESVVRTVPDALLQHPDVLHRHQGCVRGHGRPELVRHVILRPEVDAFATRLVEAYQVRSHNLGNFMS